MVVVENEVFGANDIVYVHLVAHAHNRETGENSTTVCARKTERYLFLVLIEYRNMEVDILKQGFPKVITDLPEADIQFKGVKGWIAQGESHQIVFFEIEPFAEVSEHSHDSPQWGIVVEGKIELTIGDETRVYEKGDEYFIPAHTKHSAKFLSKCRPIDFFGEKMRYKPKVR